MSQPYLGQIEFFAFGFPPKGWVACNGQLLPVNQNQALFSLLGVTYGGDGQTTFGLPDLRSRTAVGQGAGTGLSPYTLGQVGGSEAVMLTLDQIPGHTHQVAVVGNPPATPVASPAGNMLSVGTTTTTTPINLYAGASPTDIMVPQTVGNGGGGQGHENRMPFLALSPCIALAGIYPVRS